MENRIKNISNVFFARYGEYAGKKCLFTHREPKSGDLWGEDIPVVKVSASGQKFTVYGKWVDSKAVKFSES